MKKKLILLLLSMLMLLAPGCSNKSGSSAESMTLEDIVDTLYKDVDVPPYEKVSLNKLNFEYYSFVPYDDSLTAVAADALVNVTPHSMVVIHAKNGNGAELAETVAANADLNKWLCVGSEAGCVAYTDHYIVLIMSEKITVDAIADNFKNISEKLDNMKAAFLPLSNSRYEQ